MGTLRLNSRISHCCQIWLILLSFTSVWKIATSFSDSFYFEVKENSLPQTYVGKINTKADFTYRFNDDPAEFSLDPQTGFIFTGEVPLDRESRDLYNLVILSSSPTYPIEVKIRVLDLNDNTPSWPASTNTNVSFSESAPVGTKVIIDNAIDLDSGQLTYSIASVSDAVLSGAYSFGGNSLPFKLVYNASTSFLHLEVCSKLDRELQSSYLVNITATDEDQQSSFAIFTIRILDSNDNPPIFDHSDYSVSLNESVPKEVSILQVRATDADEDENDNSRITYFLSNNGENSENDFVIDPISGVISTGHDGPIKCGTTPEKSVNESWRICVFTVFAHDHGVPRQDGRTYVTAKIYDTNNHVPMIKFRYFSKSDVASVDENANNGSVVAAASVVDFDQGPNGQTTVEIINGNELNHFRLESFGNSHIIKVNGVLDREKVPRYNLTISAFDHGLPSRSSTANLIIVIQDHNDHAPSFDRKVYEVAITESQNQVGDFVFAMQATDQDEGINSQIYYSLSGANSHYFKIDATSGLITTDKVINREEIDYFELRITARDGGSSPKWANATLKVKILDANDEIPTVVLSPQFPFDNRTQQYTVMTQFGNNLDLDLIVKDNDLGNNGTVDVRILYDYDGLFRVDNESNKLVSTRTLDRTCDHFQIVLLAQDRATPEHQLSSLTTINVVGKNLGHTLEEPTLYPRQYFSNIAINSLNLSAVIVELQLLSEKDYSSVSFVIHSDDNLVQQLFYVDSNGQIRFSRNANVAQLLKSASSLLSFDIECFGCKQSESVAQVNLYVVNMEPKSANEELQFHFRVKENVPVGFAVGQIEVNIGQHVLHLVGGDLNNHFRLSGNTLHTNKPLDRETIQSYRLQAIVTSVNFWQSIAINVELIDVNDCEPRFDLPFRTITIDDRAPAMLVVHRLQTFDPDLTVGEANQTSDIEYSLIENPLQLFVIDGDELKLSQSISVATRHAKKPIRGILRVKIRTTDKATVTSVSDGVVQPLSASDSRCHVSNELTLFIRIDYTHVSRAHFLKRFYEFFISESTPINEQVFKLSARHIVNDDVASFAIVSGNQNNSFGILPSGFFYIRNRLDRESIDRYMLTVVLHETSSSSFPSRAFSFAPSTATPGSRNISSLIILDSCQVIIRVLDVNDNKPIFDRPAYRFAVPENVPKNFLLGRINAVDDDVEANGRVTYSVVKSYYSSFVQIDPLTGYLWTTVAFDRENLGTFDISVLATDQPIDQNQFSSQVTVTVDILDENDNRPTFHVSDNITLLTPTNDHSLSGKLIVSENVPVGSILARFTAVDLDQQSSISYRLINDDEVIIFLLDALNGALTLNEPLDREEIDSYELVIEASDGKFASRFELRILIDDVNDCQPVWVNMTLTDLVVPENISIGSEIMQLHAIDRDLGPNAFFHFEIENYSGTQKVFDILEHKLVVVNHLDFEKIKVHHLNISLIENSSGRIASTKSIRINLIDNNDCKPVFVQQTDTEVVRVFENIDIGTKLLTLHANDCDQNDVLTYEIVSCNTHYHTHRNIYQMDHELQHKHDSNNCPLKLNMRNGEIININNLDREVIESINLQLSVSDSVGHTNKMKVIFIVEDINDESPMFISPKKIVVSKEALSRPNSIIGSVKAIDLDMGINSIITYKLESSRYEQYFELDRFAGTFKVKNSLENLMSHELMLNVTAVDGGGLSSLDTVQFIVRPDLPYLEMKHLQIDIYENEPIGTQITKLKCHHSDPNSGCQFHLINATDRNFHVNTWTGQISTVDLIDREMLETRLLEVLVISNFNLQTVKVRINILDENDNPPYLKNTSIVVHLKESVTPGAEVLDLSLLIADEDTNNKFDYQMINCSNCDATFALNRKTGILTLHTPLDSEKISKYRILFGVSDGIYLLTSVMDVIVDDENDNKPYFNQSVYIFSIAENTDRGVVVGQVTAFDDDLSSKNLIYSILDGTDDLEIVQSSFSLDPRSGQFTLSKRLDYEVDPSQYVFYVEVSDGKYKSAPVKVIFKLLNLPDNTPRFESNVFKIEVLENTVLLDVICPRATDADLRHITDELNAIDETVDESAADQLALKYHLDVTISAKDCFNINSTNGCISISRPLDREKFANIHLTIIADDGYSNATASIEVKVLDANDNYPIFDRMTPSVIRIEENILLDTVVHTFKATDLDEPPNSYIKYEIVNDNDPEHNGLPFMIGPIDGQLKVTGAIDREIVDHFDLTIRANDYGLKYSEFVCRIEIDDVIDNSPVFEKPFLELNIYENISIGESVFKLDAKDADQIDEVNYKIISGISNGVFRIDDDSLIVSSKLNYEETNMYNLKINAIDKAGNLDTLHLRINILDVIDEKPIFLDSPYTVHWLENVVGVVDRYEAFPDNVANIESEPTLSYPFINYLLLNNYENCFRLNSSTGSLSVIKAIDREALLLSSPDSIIELKLIAIDTRSRFSSEGSVIVKVVDANDNEPCFENEHYDFELSEDLQYKANTTVGVVKATDLDEDAILEYSLESEYDEKTFSIDSSGRIYVVQSLVFDREQKAIYSMRVSVTDSKYVVSVPVVVSIADINDCTPQIVKINNVPLTNNNGVLYLKISNTQLSLMAEKKFPLLGLQVTDDDIGINREVQFRVNNDVLANMLSIDHTHGLVRFDHKSVHHLRDSLSKHGPIEIIVNDMASMNQLSSNCSVHVELTNSNSRERTLLKDHFIELSVSESEPLNESLYKFELLQPFSEISIYAGNVYGHFDIVDNRLVLVQPLDYEWSKSFDLYLQAINRQMDYEELQLLHIRVLVMDENDNPPLFQYSVYNATIPEEEEPEVFVAQVAAFDRDLANMKITYKLLNDTPVPFRIESDSGKIWSTDKIDREANGFYRLTIMAEDDLGLSSTCNCLIRIEDKNDNPPRFTRLFRVNITENTAIGRFVVQITSIDRDQKGYSNVTYELLTKTDSFEIDRYTGKVFVAGQLDREQRNEHLLTISADDGSWKAQTTLTISILDENDVAPRFQKSDYRFDVSLPKCEPNSAPMEYVIGQVQAFDDDEGRNGLLTYRLKSRSKFFTVDPNSGKILLKQPPKLYDRTEMNFLNHHFITIIASDKGLLPLSNEVSVLIRCFASDQATINRSSSSEESDSETINIVIPVNLANHTVLYTANRLISLIDSMANESIFTIRYNRLMFVGESKLRVNGNYSITINSFIGNVLINIVVTDANMFAPEFVHEIRNSTTLNEGPLIESSDSAIEHFRAIDRDTSVANNMITYSINLTAVQWNANASNYLAINYRDKYSHLFKQNFSVPELIASIRELANIVNPFSISPSTGELRLAHPLDFELITRYSLLVSATDNVWYPKQTSLQFEILVADIDDFFDHSPKSLRSARPNPMSIGVLMVIIFFGILIFAISTSFFLYHYQKKANDNNHIPVPQRKIFPSNSFNPHLASSLHPPTSNQSLSVNLHASARFAANQRPQISQTVSTQQHLSQTVGPPVSARSQPASFNVPTNHVPNAVGSSGSQKNQTIHNLPSNLVSMNSLCRAPQYRSDLPSLSTGRVAHHSTAASSVSQQLSSTKRPDIVSRSGGGGGGICSNASESASVVAARLQMQNGPSSIYTHTNSENYTDNYSNILASAEHYDLENASSIAPSDIDIVFHYNGYRNRDAHSSNHRKHAAPLTRLSPSVSEISGAPRILTLQDLSPQVHGSPLINRMQMRMHKGIHAIGSPDDDVAVTENSFNCSEFGENYDLCKKDKNMFGHMW